MVNDRGTEKDPERHVQVALGNSPTEALSALMAEKVAPARKPQAENQLEALHLLTTLEANRLDVGARFEEARHESSFSAVPGGNLWTIRAESDTRRPADAQEGRAQDEILLDPAVAELLDGLNSLQRQFDAAQDDLDALRRRLFADWYKYQLAAHPPQDARDDYPDIDLVKHFIEANDLEPIEALQGSTGDYRVLADTFGNVVRVDAADSVEATAIGSLIAESANRLIGALDTQNEAPWLLRVDDVVDWAFVFSRLKNDPRPAALQRLWELLPEATHDDLELAPEPPIQSRIVDALNAVLRRRDFYDAAAFRRVDMPRTLRDVLDSDRTAWPMHQVVRVNRGLIGGVIPLRPAVAVTASSAYRLRRTAAPRFWEPRVPSVLISGDIARPTARHGADGLVASRALRVDGSSPWETIRAEVAKFEGESDFGLAT